MSCGQGRRNHSLGRVTARPVFGVTFLIMQTQSHIKQNIFHVNFVVYKNVLLLIINYHYCFMASK